MFDERYHGRFRSRVFSFFIFWPAAIFAVFEDGNLGAQAGAMANAICAKPHSIENITLNPAAMHNSRRMVSHINYSNLYSIPELQSTNIYLSSSFHNKTIGVGLHSFGNEIYSEIMGTAALTFPIINNVNLGSSVRYGQVGIKGYGQAGTVLVDVGVLIQIKNNLYWGGAVRNIFEASLGETGEKLPQTILAGFHFSPVAPLSISLDIEKHTTFPADFRTGVQYNLFNVLHLRVGMSTEPQRMTAGFGLGFSFGGIDYGYNSHVDLGATHLFSVWFSIK